MTVAGLLEKRGTYMAAIVGALEVVMLGLPAKSLEQLR
jgi:hypothetical protein